jgi:hypothetical protein
MTRIDGNFSIHPFGILSGQTANGNITISARTRVFFQKVLEKKYSGVYSGIPGTECFDSSNCTSFSETTLPGHSNAYKDNH